jgi:hypothetical protein
VTNNCAIPGTGPGLVTDTCATSQPEPGIRRNDHLANTYRQLTAG